jgi:predicted RNA-binding protein with PUA-like domain
VEVEEEVGKEEFYFTSLCNIEEIIETIKLNKTAHKNPSTLNPSTNLSTSKINTPLITKVKIPKVSKFIGKVKITRIGFKIALTIPRTKATTIAEVKLSTCTPVNSCAVIYTESAETRR